MCDIDIISIIGFLRRDMKNLLWSKVIGVAMIAGLILPVSVSAMVLVVDQRILIRIIPGQAQFSSIIFLVALRNLTNGIFKTGLIKKKRLKFIRLMVRLQRLVI